MFNQKLLNRPYLAFVDFSSLAAHFVFKVLTWLVAAAFEVGKSWCEKKQTSYISLPKPINPWIIFSAVDSISSSEYRIVDWKTFIHGWSLFGDF